MNHLTTSTGICIEQIQFLDYKGLDWSRIEKAAYTVHQRFTYTYPGSIRNLEQRLAAIPGEQHGNQKLVSYNLKVSVPPNSIESFIDHFGNRVFKLFIARVESRITFDLDFVLERTIGGLQWPIVPLKEAELYLTPSPLTLPNENIKAIARNLKAQTNDPWELATLINGWTYQAIAYGSGATTVFTTAIEALAGGKGLCQDYAHIMLSICREVGLPARYVSGHLLGEGGSHAWVEVLLPPKPSDGHQVESNFFLAVPFDPTNNCMGSPNYLTIAVGLDYNDISPTSGRYTAPYSGQLTSTKRAGITLLKYYRYDGLEEDLPENEGSAA